MKDRTAVRYSENQSFKMGISEGETPELWHPVDNAGTPVPRKAGTGAERRKNGQSGGGNLMWNPQEDGE